MKTHSPLYIVNERSIVKAIRLLVFLVFAKKRDGTLSSPHRIFYLVLRTGWGHIQVLISVITVV